MSDLNIVEVVPVELQPHDNADSLSIVRVWDGYNVVVRTADWQGKNKGAYIPPDNLVPLENETFSFLSDGRMGVNFHRVKTKRLRGVMSQGLLVPVPDHFNVGDDVTEYFGVKRYVPVLDKKFSTGDQISGPPILGIKYDLESYFKYGKRIPEGTPIVLTEKIHGTSLKVTWQENQLWVSSRSFYRKEDETNTYWKAVKQNPWISEFCQNNPGVILHGEIYGWVQDLKYDAQPGELFVRFFDAYNSGTFWNYYEFWNELTNFGEYPERVVPIIAEGLHSYDFVMKYVSGKSTVASHIREGIVIRPKTEIYDDRVGRLCLKAVSPEYLEKN